MDTNSLVTFLFVIAVTVATVWLGVRATKGSKSTGDFFVAGRSVNVFWNASAISGEYLSAASFMGIAGLVMKNGYDALWYPVGYAAGYLFLLLFIAGPLRRFGAYTIPDFAEGRFDSPAFRKIAVSFVLFIGFFYTMPQMKGAGITMASILNWPYAVGILVVGAVITFNVAVGGMKGITLVQAFQYWVKVFAIAVPFFVVSAMIQSNTSAMTHAAEGTKPPMVATDTVVSLKGKTAAPNNALALPVGSIVLTFETDTEIGKVGPAKKGTEFAPIQPADPKGTVLPTDAVSFPWKIQKGQSVQVPLAVEMVNGEPSGKPVALKLEFDKPAKFKISDDQGQAVAAPNAPKDADWLNPFGPMTAKHGFPLLTTYSLIIALVCGTAGLPHILVRFYTNPDGKSAKRTTLLVMIFLGAFYVFTPMWGAVGRYTMPALYAGNVTDSVVIKLPTMVDNPMLGAILSGVTSAGAFAAFMSTFSGLLVSMSSAFAHDIYGKILRPEASTESRLKAFKVAAVVVGFVSMGLGLLVETFDIATMVGWAFAIGAASYFPLLLLGSWWKGLTAKGAASGMLVGGLTSLVAIVTTMLVDRKVLQLELPSLAKALMEQPAIWGVPLSMILMFVVSKATAGDVPKDIDWKMLRLHAPEALGYSKNYVDH